MAVIAGHLNAGHSGGDSVAIDIPYPSSPPLYSLHPSLVPVPNNLNNLTVSVDVKGHVYLLIYQRPQSL